MVLSGCLGGKAGEVAAAGELATVVPPWPVQVLQLLAVTVRAVVRTITKGDLGMSPKLAKGWKQVQRVVRGRVVAHCYGQYESMAKTGVFLTFHGNYAHLCDIHEGCGTREREFDGWVTSETGELAHQLLWRFWVEWSLREQLPLLVICDGFGDIKLVQESLRRDTRRTRFAECQRADAWQWTWPR